jgi:hypothetical protein
VAAIANGLAAATRREREEMLSIDVPLKPPRKAGTINQGHFRPSPNVERYQSFAAAEAGERLYIRIQDAKTSH